MQWKRLEHGGRTLDQWITEGGEPGFFIAKAGPWMGYGRNTPHYLLSSAGQQVGLYDTLGDAMQAAEDPSSIEPLRPIREA